MSINLRSTGLPHTQFFAVTDEECWHAFGVEPKEGKPDDHEYDEEVVCTSYYSQFEPTENGEVHIRRVKMATAPILDLC